MLLSKAGMQRGAPGHSCVTVPPHGDPPEGVTGCGTTVPWDPQRLSVVRPRELVIIRIRAAEAEGVVHVRRFGRWRRPLRSFRFTGPNTEWRVPLRAGYKYTLDVRVNPFRMPEGDGRYGFTYSGLGLFVSRKAVRKIVPAPRTRYNGRQVGVRSCIRQ